MKEVFTFISSDYRDFYKADVFKVLSLPEGAVAHFRYKTEHISKELLSNIFTLEKRGCIIFFRVCNEELKPSNSNKSNLDFSIRHATVEKIEKANDTGIVHFFLKLGNFNVPRLEDSKLPEDLKHVDKRQTNELFSKPGPTRNWADIAKDVFEFFPTDTLVRFTRLIEADSNIEQKPKLSWGSKSCYYELTKSGRYIVELASYNNSKKKAGFSFKSNSDNIVLQKIDNHVSDLTHDNYYIPVNVALADSAMIPDGFELSVLPPLNGPETDTGVEKLEENFGFHLPVLVKNNCLTSILIGFLTAVGLSGILLLAPIRGLKTSSDVNWFWIVVGFILVAASSALLAHRYKKNK
ncbi:hypothetical protein [Idiomarina abyssalis]|uniref:hypothetical protein n=1 Tax=Idiomarina abyssalis TaxID=86102 RepID=UPI003A933666